MNALTIGIILGVYGAMSLVTFIAYGADKRAASLDRRRTSEARLHLLALAFGWPGAFLARRLLRHKTRKQPFTLVFWLTGLLHLGAWGAFLWWVATREGS